MVAIPDVTTIGMLIGQETRSTMLLLLLDGRARTATELADASDVSRPTASFHLGQLVEGGLLRIERQGKHRYFRLASPEIAALLESMLVVAGTTLPDATLQTGPRSNDMRQARMCYDHIAGKLGIGIVDSLVHSGTLIETPDSFLLTVSGTRHLESLGIDVAAARRRRRHFARTCIDWSERRPHLAGSLGAAIADRLFASGWIEREPEGRTVYITPAGQRGLAGAFGIDIQVNVMD